LFGIAFILVPIGDSSIVGLAILFIGLAISTASYFNTDKKWRRGECL
jgi:hypothetical protein